MMELINKYGLCISRADKINLNVSEQKKNSPKQNYQ